MDTITIAHIAKILDNLPQEKLEVVYDFVLYLTEKDKEQDSPSGALGCMLASESVLSRDWERPEEDEAWAHL